MTDTERLMDKFNNCCFTLSKEDIHAFDKKDNGPINNVMAGLAKHCFGVHLFDDEFGLTADLFYINNDNSLKGDLIRLDIKNEHYFKLLLRFCTLLADDYSEVDAIDAFNTFQSKIRGFIEKLGFFTTTNIELEKFKGKSISMMYSSQRGIIKLEFIDKAQFYRDFFNNNYKDKFLEDSEYVYLMLNADTSLIKIGTSKNPEYRERTLHSQEPSIHLIAKWTCSKSIEKELHKMFDHKRIRGEWFRLTLKELKGIEEFMNFEINKSS